MRRDTTPKTVVETKTLLTRSQIRKDIMLTPMKMMNRLIKDLKKKINIPQVMRDMYFDTKEFY